MNTDRQRGNITFQVSTGSNSAIVQEALVEEFLSMSHVTKLACWRT